MFAFQLINQTGLYLPLLNETVEYKIRFSEGEKILIILLASLLIFLTVSGNSLVILAFIVDKTLRTQNNFFLLNLAICDFFIGAFSTPLYLMYMIPGKWMLGRFMCKLWLTIDYMMCTASAFNVVLISYDRFLAVTNAVVYRYQQKKHSQTVFKMTAVWILSFMVYGPAIIFWQTLFGGNILPDGICLVDFMDVWYVHLVTSIFDFAVPLISISFFNLSIYWNIKKRSKQKRHSSVHHLLKEKWKGPYIISTNLVPFTSPLKNTKEVSRPVKKEMKTLFTHCSHWKVYSSAPTCKRQNTNNVQITQLSRDKEIAKSLVHMIYTNTRVEENSRETFYVYVTIYICDNLELQAAAAYHQGGPSTVMGPPHSCKECMKHEDGP
ncbi:histamine H3 receptor-like [Pelodytes ibericus]